VSRLVPEPSYTAKWDAWNRLVKLTNDADANKTVAEFEYDGLNRRTVKKSYTSAGTLDKTHHYYYSDLWQVLEERVDSSSTADKQFVWGLRYVDDLVLRDENSTRYYALQDANWNVVAVASNTGSILERYAYTPYGVVEFLNASFVAHLTQESDISNDLLYTGRRRDPETGLQLKEFGS